MSRAKLSTEKYFTFARLIDISFASLVDNEVLLPTSFCFYEAQGTLFRPAETERRLSAR
jgi:hypothetical protein